MGYLFRQEGLIRGSKSIWAVLAPLLCDQQLNRKGASLHLSRGRCSEYYQSLQRSRYQMQ